jgi:hypothetical protein
MNKKQWKGLKEETLEITKDGTIVKLGLLSGLGIRFIVCGKSDEECHHKLLRDIKRTHTMTGNFLKTLPEVTVEEVSYKWRDL